MEDFNFKNGQVIWVKNPDIVYQLDEIVPSSIVFGLENIKSRHLENAYQKNEHYWKFEDHILEYRDILEGSPYLFRVNSEFRLEFYTDTRSCKIDGVEVNQNAEGFSVNDYLGLVKTLPEKHPIKHRGISGPSGYYIHQQDSMTKLILEKNPVLYGTFLDKIDGGYRFFFSFYDSNQIEEFNLKLRPLVRSNKIDIISKQK